MPLRDHFHPPQGDLVSIGRFCLRSGAPGIAGGDEGLKRNEPRVARPEVLRSLTLPARQGLPLPSQSAKKESPRQARWRGNWSMFARWPIALPGGWLCGRGLARRCSLGLLGQAHGFLPTAAQLDACVISSSIVSHVVSCWHLGPQPAAERGRSAFRPARAAPGPGRSILRTGRVKGRPLLRTGSARDGAAGYSGSASESRVT